MNRYSKGLQLLETERWWNSKNILKFDLQYKKSYRDKNVVLYQNLRRNTVFNLLDKDLKNKKILEIGFGAGQLLELMLKKKKSNHYYGVEISHPLLKKTKKRLAKIKNKKLNLSVQNLDKKLKFKDKSFDLIIAVGVLHYSADIEKALKEINRLLKKNGKFIIAQRSGYSLSYLFGFRYLFRTLIYLFSKEKYEIFPSFRAIFCDSQLFGKYFKKYEKTKIFNSQFFLKGHDFYQYKVKKRLMTPGRMKHLMLNSGFKILNFKGGLFEYSKARKNYNYHFDLFLKKTGLSVLLKNFTSVLVLKMEKKN